MDILSVLPTLTHKNEPATNLELKLSEGSGGQQFIRLHVETKFRKLISLTFLNVISL